MSGIEAYGVYVPYYRLSRQSMGGGKGERAIAGFDEDSASMAVEAAREALKGGTVVDHLLFATTSVPYAEKLNAATIQSALGLQSTVATLDIGNSSRMGLSALLLGLELANSGKRVLVTMADIVIGGPGGTRESQSGDAAAAFIISDSGSASVELLNSASSTKDVLDTWRLPEDAFPRQWEERFGAEALAPVLEETVRRALDKTGLQPGDLSKVILDAANARITTGLPRLLGLAPEQMADSLGLELGRCGTAHAGLVLANVLDTAEPGSKILIASVVDGCDVVIMQVGDSIAAARPRRSVTTWINSKTEVAYNTYLKWRGILPFEPPRRPDPDRPAAPPSYRSGEWKMAFTGSKCSACGMVHLPPQRVCSGCGCVDVVESVAMSNIPCSIATYTLDYLAYTLQPPVIAAAIDFEGGGRFSGEIVDIDPSTVKIGDKLEMTFRRLFTAQGVHNYFWKARPVRGLEEN